NGCWLSELRLEHVGYGVNKLHWGERFHSNDYVEWIVRSWILERFQTRIHTRPVVEVLSKLSELVVPEDQPEAVEEALYQWALVYAIEGSTIARPDITAGMRLLYRWCLEEDLPGFSEI